jgi:Cu(I)/Ag(I) efflux system membrane fusion protein
MKSATGLAVGAIAVAILAGSGGYWMGNKGIATLPMASNPATTGSSAAAAKPEKKLLFYRNPMGLPDTSPVPKKDPMGMDYIAVYEGESADDDAASPNQVNISSQKVQKLGVRTELAQRRSLDKLVRAAGRIEPDERRIAMVSAKFEGYVDRLHVNTTGQWVTKGQPLFEVYSPELVSVQREYAIAVQGAESLKGADSPAQLGMGRLVESSLQRLKNWDISEEQIKALMASGETRRTMTFRSPVAGVVTEKKAVQGMRFMPGEALFQVSDLSAVWVIADVFEQDLGLVKTGAKAKVKINAYPGKPYSGTVTYVYPTLNSETRTVPVRVELANPGGLLKPGMFAEMELVAASKGQVLTVPVSAVIDSGTRQVVLVQLKEGRFDPREVKLGARSDNYIEVMEGIQEGEQVVVAANFLIDAESNLKAALAGFGQPAAKGVSNQAQGTVEDVDVPAGTVTLHHGPVASLNWPAMTMEFQVANASLLKSLKPGAKVSIEFVERKPGEWVITSVKSADPHTGH